jgi:hypothetical protein
LNQQIQRRKLKAPLIDLARQLGVTKPKLSPLVVATKKAETAEQIASHKEFAKAVAEHMAKQAKQQMPQELRDLINRVG